MYTSCYFLGLLQKYKRQFSLGGGVVVFRQLLQWHAATTISGDFLQYSNNYNDSSLFKTRISNIIVIAVRGQENRPAR